LSPVTHYYPCAGSFAAEKRKIVAVIFPSGALSAAPLLSVKPRQTMGADAPGGFLFDHQR
jgi:hypothetical protein